MSDTDIVPTGGQLVGMNIGGVPSLFLDAGPKTQFAYIEYFTAHIRNANTRAAYHQALKHFSLWCERKKLRLRELNPFFVACYIEELGLRASKPTVKQHLAAIRMFCDFLVVRQMLPLNPAASVRGPKHIVSVGKTPVLSGEETRHLLDSIDEQSLIGLRDRALISVMVYSFARVSAVAAMNVEDFFPQGKRYWFRLHEKGGKEHQVPAHHKAEEVVDAYIAAAGIGNEKGTPLFRTLDRRHRLTPLRIQRREILAMVKRRSRKAGILTDVCCHSFRATGITAYLLNGGILEHAQKIAAHSSPRTTKLYDRTSDAISLDEIEKITF